MPLTTIIDASFGDVGKGAIVDRLAKDYDIITKNNGAANSGRSIVYNGEKYICRILPSGILNNNMLVIGQGVLLDLEVFLNELKTFEKFNILGRLMVSNKCHLLLPYHKQADILNENKTNNKVGSTKNGVAFCVQDKVGRRGIRVIDVINGQYEAGDVYYQVMNNMEFWGINVQKEIIDLCSHSLLLIDEFIKLNKKYNFCGDTGGFINKALKENKKILNEAVNGTLLDIESNSYPYVTSTPCTAAGVCLGLNIAPKNLNKVIGITKAYTTRVGGGPFATELFDSVGDEIRKNGNEFGSVTGRPRRVGWLNLDELIYANTVNGFDELAITKVDVFFGINPIKVLLNGKYVEMEGWSSIDDSAFWKYICLIKETVGVNVKYISYGPDRNDMRVL